MTEVKDSFEVIVSALTRTHNSTVQAIVELLERQYRTEDNRLSISKEDLAINNFITEMVAKIKKLKE
jgi:hypothetical protein